MIAQSYNALLNKKNVPLIAAVVIGLLIVLGLFVLPLKKAITRKAQEYKGLQAQLILGYQNQKIFQRNGVPKKLIGQKDVAAVIDSITKEGRRLALNFKSLSPQEPVDANAAYAALPVRMELEGDYKQAGLFLGALENLNGALVSVDSFHIIHEEKIFPKLLISFTVHIYLTKGDTIDG